MNEYSNDYGRPILISFVHFLSLLLFSQENRTLHRGEEKWGKKSASARCLGRTMQHASVVGVKMLVNARKGRERANVENDRSVRTLSRPFLRRFPTVVFNALSLAVPSTSTSPSLPIAPSKNCHAARTRAFGFIDTFNICSRSLCYSSSDVNNNRASHPWYPG